MTCETCKMHNSYRICACTPGWSLGPGDKHTIEMYVRQLHVATSYTKLAKDMLKRAAKYPRHVRHEVARHAIDCHRQNLITYHAVMSGQL